MLVAINRSMRRRKGRLGLMLAVLVLSGTVVMAHGAMGAGHMGPGMAGGHMAGDRGTAVIAMCLAVAETAALAFGALALGRAMRSHTLLPRPITWPARPELLLASAVQVPRARPPDLSLLQVFRR